jgi:hypothetical protein
MGEMDGMSKELSQTAIVEALAHEVSKRVTQKVISILEDLTATLSGAALRENVWEVICIQKQIEQSNAWKVYDETVRITVVTCLSELPDHERNAIWLQTDVGRNWASEDEKDRKAFPVNEEDIARYLLLEYIYPATERLPDPP